MPDLKDGERLAVVETKVDALKTDVDDLHNAHTALQTDFTILKTRFGLITAVIAALFSGLVNLAIDLFKG